MGEIILELVVGLVLVALGFAVLWLFVGESAFDHSATNAWALGSVIVTVVSVTVLATRETLEKRRAKREERERRRLPSSP